MNCFVGLILIASVYINPCNIQKMYSSYDVDDEENKPSHCTVVFANDTEEELGMECAFVQSKLEEKRRYER